MNPTWFSFIFLFIVNIVIACSSTIHPTESTNSLKSHQNISANMDHSQDYVVTEAITTESVKKPPIIGVLTQVFRDYKNFVDERSLHLVASYVKWLESSGAQVLPILINQTPEYYEEVFKSTQGLLLPGGDNILDPARNTPMMVAAKKLYALATESNDRGRYYPIWGTCLGMELLTVLSSGRNTLKKCHAKDESLNMEFSKTGRMFAPGSYANLSHDTGYTNQIMNALREKNVTYNSHFKCVTDESLKLAKIDHFYNPLAYSKDVNGKMFIAIMEAHSYPFFAVQFHPEKPAFEYQVRKHQQNIPHSAEANAVSRYFADFFIEQAKKSPPPVTRTNPNRLIYSKCPTYLGSKGDMYEQRYIWPFSKAQPGIDTGEFIDRIIEDGELVDEEVSRAGLELSQT